jgi:curved DNA-binding protein CbpA
MKSYLAQLTRRARTLLLRQPTISLNVVPSVVFTCNRTYFTNTDLMKRDDPYACLGLTWGATVSDIKEAYRKKARELHPDVSTEPSEVALKKFQQVQKAYNSLMDVKGAPHRNDLQEEWSFSVWRNSDILAQERTDVAGLKRKRPKKPAASQKNPNWGVATLGHPNGGGIKIKRGEYLQDGLGNGRSSSVGTGQSKWVTSRKLEPFDPSKVAGRRASDRLPQQRGTKQKS